MSFSESLKAKSKLYNICDCDIATSHASSTYKIIDK